ncbi:carboxypeptidase-like regulatory domain-containing protein [Glycomyces sp. NRRL B-16210]|uniref:carboxypeptidase-like regulatory domain-containing protein n=1 Tax=Glycomyces sp. NRRL B-16210 TaxID=1463821 RepID=UPI0004C2A37C|nr:carboxypeptidase regulatory-like domain-containing protein [Glycomyces sp. NRRL B-16210]
MTVAAEPSGTQTNVLGSRRRRGGGLRARLAGLAAAAGVLLGVLAFPQAAFAQGDFAMTINTQNPWIDIGGAPVNISVTVVATHQDPNGKDLNVEGVLRKIDNYAYVGIADGGGCSPSGDSSVSCGRILPGESRTITFAVTPMSESDLPQGEQKSGEFKAKLNGGSDQSTSVTVVGAAVTATAANITGTVTSDAEPVEGAKVVLTDAEGKNHETTTGGDGGFRFDGSSDNPIAPGDMTIKVTKEGFEEASQDINVSSNSTFNANLTLRQVATEEATTEAPTTEAATTEAAPSPTEAADEGGISGTLVFLIIVGALLVIGGIVGIVFLLRGGKDDKDEDEEESFAPDGPPDHTPTAAQVGSPGVYQAGPAPGSDAPTMLHPGGLVDNAAPTQFGPAYGGESDSTQVMPQAGFGAPPAPNPDATTILPVVKQPGGPGGADATQIMPQANLSGPPPAAPPSPYADPNATRPHPGPSAPPSPYADPNATRPHPGPSPYGADPGATRPHPAPTPPPATGSMFDPQNPGIAPGAPSEPRYGSHGSPSAPPAGPPSAPQSAPQSASQFGPGSQSYSPQGGQPTQGYSPQAGGQPGGQPGSQPGAGFGQQAGSQPNTGFGPQAGSQPNAGFGSQPGSQPSTGYGSHSAQPPAPQSDQYPGQSMRRDPYAPPEQPAQPSGEFGATRAMPQYGDQSQPPAAPYGSEPNREGEGEEPDSRRTERRSWGEWDDRPRSW